MSDKLTPEQVEELKQKVIDGLNEYAAEYGRDAAVELLLETTKDIEAQNLKRCPFCSSEKVRAVGEAGETSFFVFCDNCFTHGPHKDAEREARLAWNSRDRSVC